MITLCKLISGEVLEYDACSSTPNAYDPKVFSFIGCGVVFKVGNHYQSFDLDNHKNLDYFWVRRGENTFSGKKFDVLAEKESDTRFTIWADKGNLEKIRKISGVKSAFAHDDTEYVVFLDHRYDVNIVIQNILDALN